MIHIALILFISAAFVTDARKSIIPNKLTISGVVFGFVYHGVTDGWSGLLLSALGLLAGFGVLMILYAFGALGAGDVKLFAALGAIMGIGFVLQALVYSVLYGGLIGIIILLVRKQLAAAGSKLTGWFLTIAILRNMEAFRDMKRQNNLKFPFMYAVVPGVMTAWYYTYFVGR